jgi:methanogenic corrinoid protein MtbC1
MATTSGESRDGTDHLIGCLTYESRAAKAPSEDELNALVAAARVRNESLGVTGMLLYDKGRFLQTLEGPVDGLGQVWASIQRDERHSGIEVLTQHLVGARLFSQWSLLHYRKLERPAMGLRARLARRHPLAHYVPEVVQLALAGEEDQLKQLVADLVAKGWSADDLARDLWEPAARGLGDAWLVDEASEFDVTLAMGFLQMASHAVHSTTCLDTLRTGRYTILIAPAPGEAHMLGTSLLADQFTQQGWGVDMAFPDTDLELVKALRQQQPDALDLAMSDALLRPEGIARLRQTIERARLAVPQTALVISVGGRLFAEAAATAEHVSADHARRSSAGTEVALSELVRHRRKMAGQS